MKKTRKFLSLVMTVLMLCSCFVVANVQGANAYTINGKIVRYTDFSSSPNECWTYANNIYNKIWGQKFNYNFSDSSNSLRNLSDSQLLLNATNLKNYVSHAALGSCLRICNGEYLHGTDGWGHSQIIVQKDANGFTVFEGGLSASPYKREKYYTWSEYCSTGWLGGTYKYIKYIKWPGASAYNGTDSNSKVKFHSMGINDIATNNATISTWTTNNGGEFFSCGFWFGEKDNMQLFTTYAHKSWTEFHGIYKLSDYYGQLSPGRTYYYKFYLISASDMSYYESETYSFKTYGLSNVSFGNVSTIDVNSLDAKISSWAWNDNGYTITSLGFYFGDSPTSMKKYQVNSNIAWTNFYTEVDVANYAGKLTPGKTYYYRFYAIIDTTYYSDLYSFTTSTILPSFTVNFNANGGSISINNKTVTYGDTYGNLPTPTRAGYTFDGWYTSATGGTKVTASTKVTATSNHTLYAHWTCNHSSTEIKNTKTATCTAVGFTGDTYCITCSAKLKSGSEIDKLSHSDTNSDYKCDYGCGYDFEKPEVDAPTTPDNIEDTKIDCSCNCHKGGIAGFFFKLINFFEKLFGKNKVCACGVKH